MEQGLHEKGKKKVKCTGSTDPLPGVRVNLTHAIPNSNNKSNNV